MKNLQINGKRVIDRLLNRAIDDTQRLDAAGNEQDHMTGSTLLFYLSLFNFADETGKTAGLIQFRNRNYYPEIDFTRSLSHIMTHFLGISPSAAIKAQRYLVDHNYISYDADSELWVINDYSIEPHSNGRGADAFFRVPYYFYAECRPFINKTVNSGRAAAGRLAFVYRQFAYFSHQFGLKPKKMRTEASRRLSIKTIEQMTGAKRADITKSFLGDLRDVFNIIRPQVRTRVTSLKHRGPGIPISGVYQRWTEITLVLKDQCLSDLDFKQLHKNQELIKEQINYELDQNELAHDMFKPSQLNNLAVNTTSSFANHFEGLQNNVNLLTKRQNLPAVDAKKMRRHVENATLASVLKTLVKTIDREGMPYNLVAYYLTLVKNEYGHQARLYIDKDTPIKIGLAFSRSEWASLAMS